MHNQMIWEFLSHLLLLIHFQLVKKQVSSHRSFIVLGYSTYYIDLHESQNVRNSNQLENSRKLFFLHNPCYLVMVSHWSVKCF